MAPSRTGKLSARGPAAGGARGRFAADGARVVRCADEERGCVTVDDLVLRGAVA
ncbi:MAG: hypothetical protein HS111_14610 [Kofleriaceae bacterium]|nr:hypothetical protein [Kofleriaceae bacterium]MCL4225464.1 hypothetical protein [Myxococcales bacterium]